MSSSAPDLANRSASFVLVDGVGLYGGFNGTETSRSQRDTVAHPTILRGDLRRDDDTLGIALDRPVLSRDSATGKFTLVTGLLSSPDVMTPFTPFTGFTPSFNPGTGEISIEFDPANPDAHFFQVFGNVP